MHFDWLIFHARFKTPELESVIVFIRYMTINIISPPPACLLSNRSSDERNRKGLSTL